MGSTGSRERVITVAPEASAELQARENVNIHEIERQRAAAEASYREAEHSIFREGYARGRQDALSSIEEEIAKSAHVAYAEQALADEKKRADALAKEIDALRKHQYRAPLRAPGCAAEEAAVQQCGSHAPRGSACAAAVDAYVACAEGVVHGLMNPGKRPLA